MAGSYEAKALTARPSDLGMPMGSSHEGRPVTAAGAGWVPAGPYEERPLTASLVIYRREDRPDGSASLLAGDVGSDNSVRVEVPRGVGLPQVGDGDFVLVTGRFKPTDGHEAFNGGLEMLASEVRPGIYREVPASIRQEDLREPLDPMSGDNAVSLRISVEDLVRATKAKEEGVDLPTRAADLTMKVADSYVIKDESGADLLVFVGRDEKTGTPVRAEFDGARMSDAHTIDALARSNSDILEMKGVWKLDPSSKGSAEMSWGEVELGFIGPIKGVFSPAIVNGSRVERLSGYEEDLDRVKDLSYRMKAGDPARVASRFADAIVVEAFATRPALTVLDRQDGPTVAIQPGKIPSGQFVGGKSALRMLSDHAVATGQLSIVVDFDMERARAIDLQRSREAQRARPVRESAGAGL